MAPFLTLTGFMGSGKTAVGKRAAALLGWRFADLDAEIERREGLTVEAFFATRGEPAFRTREVELLETLLSRHDPQAREKCDAGAGTEPPDGSGLLVALGGGTLESERAAALLRGRGEVLYLDVGAEEAWERVKGTGRPLARDRHEFEALLARRRARYEDVADWIVPVGKKTEDRLAEEIVELVRLSGGRRPHMWGRRLDATGRRSLILGGRDSLSSLERLSEEEARRGHRLFGLTDENVARHWGDQIVSRLAGRARGAAPLVLRPGEQTKSLAQLGLCWEWLAENGARRDDIVLALGGGVIGDLAGFAASTYHRGVSLWQIPTSLLAQVDSSVGGKTGIDLKAGKNLAGSFYQPDVVLIDPATLATLPDHEYSNGLGEVVKYGLLRSAESFDRLEGEADAILARDQSILAVLVKSCVSYKAQVVEEDELDRGRRAVLNLGHTTAHALETTLGYGAMGHGRAVGLGLLVALAVSEKLLGLDPSLREQTEALLARFGLSASIPVRDTGELIEAMARDKKVTTGSRGFVGLEAVGSPVWDLDVPASLLAECLEVIKA